jgi:nucleoporin GLE1
MVISVESPYKRAPDSPSRQLLWELNRLSINEQLVFQQKLDEDAAQREKLHKEALAKAAAEHERIRRGAERERERLEIQIQIERERREAEERKELKELERQRKEKVERELAERRKEIERAQALEAEKRKAVELKKAEEDAANKREQDAAKQREQAAAKQREIDAELARKRVAQAEQESARRVAEELKAKEAAKAALSARPSTNPQEVSKPVPSIATTAALPHAGRDSSREAEHTRYLEIHKKLKEFRKDLENQVKADRSLKKQMGDMRRTIRKCVGQFTGNTKDNLKPVRAFHPSLVHING